MRGTECDLRYGLSSTCTARICTGMGENVFDNGIFLKSDQVHAVLLVRYANSTICESIFRSPRTSALYGRNSHPPSDSLLPIRLTSASAEHNSRHSLLHIDNAGKHLPARSAQVSTTMGSAEYHLRYIFRSTWATFDFYQKGGNFFDDGNFLKI